MDDIKTLVEEAKQALVYVVHRARGRDTYMTELSAAKTAIDALAEAHQAEVARLTRERDELNDARNAAIERCNFMHGATREAQALASAYAEDAWRLNAMQERRLTLEEWMGRGGVIGWRVTAFSSNEAIRVELAFGETPRAAIDAALAGASGAQEGERT
jgi:hypothetical protein